MKKHKQTTIALSICTVLAAATGAAVVLTEGTADCCMADVERILSQTTVRSQ